MTEERPPIYPAEWLSESPWTERQKVDKAITYAEERALAVAEASKYREEASNLRAENERLKQERDEAQRNYLNTKGWWNAERESARKHEGTIAGMRTEIEELEARAKAAEAERDLFKAYWEDAVDVAQVTKAALEEMREAAKLVISATVKSDGSMFDALDALRSLANKGEA